jgi:hypothetical protein
MSKARKIKRNPRMGGTFDDFLREEGIYETVQTTAIKRVLGKANSRSSQRAQTLNEVTREKTEQEQTLEQKLLEIPAHRRTRKGIAKESSGPPERAYRHRKSAAS